MKKTYFAPEADIVEVELEPMLGVDSDGGNGNGGNDGEGGDMANTSLDEADLNQTSAKYSVWDL